MPHRGTPNSVQRDATRVPDRVDELQSLGPRALGRYRPLLIAARRILGEQRGIVALRYGCRKAKRLLRFLMVELRNRKDLKQGLESDPYGRGTSRLRVRGPIVSGLSFRFNPRVGEVRLRSIRTLMWGFRITDSSAS